jgi:hypothetical protein
MTTRDKLERDFAAYIAKKNGLTIEEALARVSDGTYPRAPTKAKKRGSSAQPKRGTKRKTAAQRIAKRLGPDDGRRGGSPTVQGGSPGLGKRR